MPTPELGPVFNPERTAQSVHETVSRRFPDITSEDSREVVQNLSDGARITTFIPALAQRQLEDLAKSKSNKV